MNWFAAFVVVWASATLTTGQQSSTTHDPKLQTTTPPPVTDTTTHVPTTHKATTSMHSSTTHETTTTPRPTTTVAPPTPPHVAPPVNKYVLNDTDGHTCVMMDAALQLKITYLTKDSKWKEILWVLDNTTTVDKQNSSCGHTEQTMALRFGTSLLSLTFTKNETIYLSDIVVAYRLEFPDAEHQGDLVTTGNSSLHLYGVEQGRSYQCGVDSSLYLGTNTTLDIVSVQLQAFVNNTGSSQPDSYGSAVYCAPENDISNIVPIAVGSALAALVVIVLLAYLVGRSRSRQKGYQSV